MRVVIAGGGVAALETVLALRALAGARVSIELLAPEEGFVDRPSSVATAFGLGAREPHLLEAIADREHVTLRRGSLAAVEDGRRRAITRDGSLLPYDALVVATGARAQPGVPGATTFAGPADVPALEAIMQRAAGGEVRHLVFALPQGISWSLPLYELAIMAAVALRGGAATGADITVVTPEREPLWVFGPTAAAALARMLEERGITLRTDARAVSVAADRLLMAGGAWIAADAVVALPTLVAAGVEGLPEDAGGFIPVNAHGRVEGTDGVYAAGDVTAFPVKQGGLATQQADAVAAAIAATTGAIAHPAPFRPVLRGVLLTGGAPLYLRAELSPSGDVERATGVRLPRGEASTHALWWPPAKVAGRYLGPYLAGARPVALAREPLRDRTPLAITRPATDTDDAFSLAVLVAEEDARIGDFARALNALDAAAALRGGVLPSELARRRAEWARSATA